MVREFNVLITGVGGQGGITLSRMITDAAARKGLKVVRYESLGMAQRGGAVQAHIRLGEDIFSPLIPSGRADVVIALEPNEALRVVDFIGDETSIILNIRKIPPIPALMGEVNYPLLAEEISLLENLGRTVYTLDAYELAKEVGTTRVANTVILGAFSKLNLAPLTRDELLQSVKSIAPQKYLKENIAAFEVGEKELEKRGTQK